MNDENARYATEQFMQTVSINRTYYMVLLFYSTVLGAFTQNIVNPINPQ